MINEHMNSYYCVKKTLCEVLFKSVSFQPLKYSQEGSILYPPPPLLSFPRLFNSELLGCLPHSKYIRGAPTTNVPEIKTKVPTYKEKHD